MLRRGIREAVASHREHGGMTVGSIREDARLRDRALEVLERDRGVLSRGTAGDVLAHLKHALRDSLPPSGAAGLEPRRRTPPSEGARARAWIAVGAALLAALFHDLLATLRGLWHEATDPRRSPLLPFEMQENALAKAFPPRPVERALTRVATIKRGRFRRRMLARLLALFGHGGALEGALGLAASGFQSARWTLTPSGQLVYTSRQDESTRLGISRLGLAERVLVALVWSSTRAVPRLLPALSPRLSQSGGLEERLLSHEVPAELAYSAYPAVSAANIETNAELRSILTAEPRPGAAERLLELV
jgi:hypothetical protein